MRTENVQPLTPGLPQLPQTLLIEEAKRPVHFHQPLIKSQAHRTGGRGRHLAVKEIGVARMQQPALPLLDGDPGMAAGMAAQRHEQNLRWQAVQLANAFEAEPGFSIGVIDLPAADIAELVRPVTPTGDKAAS